VTDSQEKSQSPPVTAVPADPEIDLFDYLLVIWRAKWSIAVLCVLAMGLTVAVMFTRPRYYRASVTIVPPLDALQRESGGGLGALGNPLLRTALGNLGGTIAGIYVEILESREVADTLIDRFALMEVYEGIEYRSDARKRLARNTKIEATKDGAVKVAVQDRDPNRSAAIAAAYIEELDAQNKKLSGGHATSKRVFLEHRLKEIQDRLRRFENIPAHEARVQEMLYEMLVRETELAKIEEARNMPTIQVLDPPGVPELPVARGTVQKGILAGVAAFLLGVFLAFTREYIVQARGRSPGLGPAAARREPPDVPAAADLEADPG
jgi:uncharacterized protein involved in exopolysaccharide biosynthesis